MAAYKEMGPPQIGEPVDFIERHVRWRGVLMDIRGGYAFVAVVGQPATFNVPYGAVVPCRSVQALCGHIACALLNASGAACLYAEREPDSPAIAALFNLN